LSQHQVNTVSKICSDSGVSYAVISPGSRSAPLTLAFARNPSVKCIVVPDERSAGFIALGIAQHTKKPVVLVCTSGTAGLNYGPAIAEAFYQHVPLLVLTADRPPELIDQKDGQTIRQVEMFRNHVKGSFNISDDINNGKNGLYELVQKALRVCTADEKGPVHINYPFREPFYPDVSDFKVEDYSKTEGTLPNSAESLSDHLFEIGKYCKVLVLSGQNEPTTELRNELADISNKQQIPIVGDILTNLHGNAVVIKNPELIFMSQDDELKSALQPELLITFGDSLISKNLKLYLRKFKPAAHWHIQPAGIVADTFQSLTRHIKVSQMEFFKSLNGIDAPEGFESQKRSNYLQAWKVADERAVRLRDRFLQDTEFGELRAVMTILPKVPANSILHLGNSMPVRLANLIGVTNAVIVRSNRGTSGIDGTNGTAVGNAISDSLPVTLITGDIAFFYDRNAFWHNESLANLRIIILNNGGGGIFGMIDGPTKQPELSEFFLTPHSLTAKNTAQDYGMDYIAVAESANLKKNLETFWEPSDRGKILEVFTNQEQNQYIYRKLKQALKVSR